MATLSKNQTRLGLAATTTIIGGSLLLAGLVPAQAAPPAGSAGTITPSKSTGTWSVADLARTDLASTMKCATPTDTSGALLFISEPGAETPAVADATTKASTKYAMVQEPSLMMGLKADGTLADSSTLDGGFLVNDVVTPDLSTALAANHTYSIGYACATLAADGVTVNLAPAGGKAVASWTTLKTDASKNWSISSTFKDVAPTTQFVDDMNWLAAKGISTGWTETDGSTTYRPLQPVNRDAMAAFMYRLSGNPIFTAPATSPFPDIKTSTQFYKEMSWLADQGISTGWAEKSGKSYRPLQSVNRDAMAAFMYRLAGNPTFTAPAASPFKDVATNNQFYKEITWLASTGITTGWTEKDGSKTYRPLQPVNRDAMAAFMHRYNTQFGNL